MGKKIIRVFPRRTRATPTDDLVRIGCGPFLWDRADEVHISVLFSWDIENAEHLAEEWRHVAPIVVGGPATGMRGEQFVPGKYVRHGYTITSRGCPNKCWFCSVWRRDGETRELEIRDGWNVLDDNLLACSEAHVRAVFAMLERQKKRPEFTGGMEAKRLRSWHVDLLASVRPRQMFFAYDTPDDLEPLVVAGRMLRDAGFGRHQMRCYVLCGYQGDTQTMAERRMLEVVRHGFFPMAMCYRDNRGDVSLQWKRFGRQWSRPAIIYSMVKDVDHVYALE